MESAKTAISTLVSNLKQVGYHPQVSVTHAPLKRARQPEMDGCNCGVYVWALVNDHPLDFDPANIENLDGDLWCAGPKHEPPLEMGPQQVDFFCRFQGPVAVKETDVVEGTGLGLTRQTAEISRATPDVQPCPTVDDAGRLITVNHHDNIFNFRHSSRSLGPATGLRMNLATDLPEMLP